MLTIENNISAIQQVIKITGSLKGIDALHFRDKTATIIKIKEGPILFDVSQINSLDLTGFNAVVMLKKEASKRNLSFILIANEENPIHEFIHLSKLSFDCVKQQS